ncbi:MAG: hypothetical protein JO369_02345 [Paucibacter sp.]|nr:hypothetical protein [Roseateles sp.]
MESLRIVPTFSSDDAAWLRRNKIDVPRFWAGHGVAPQTGDALRIGGRQFIVQARVWEQDGQGTTLKLFLSDSHAQSDTVFM